MNRDDRLTFVWAGIIALLVMVSAAAMTPIVGHNAPLRTSPASEPHQ